MTNPLPKVDLSEQITRRIEDMARLRRAVEAARARIGNKMLSAVLGDGILICDFDCGRYRKYEKRVRYVYAHFDDEEVDEAIKFVESF